MQLQTESGIWAEADARVFSILMGGNRTERRMMAADRTVQAAIRRVASGCPSRAERADDE